MGRQREAGTCRSPLLQSHQLLAVGCLYCFQLLLLLCNLVLQCLQGLALVPTGTRAVLQQPVEQQQHTLSCSVSRRDRKWGVNRWIKVGRKDTVKEERIEEKGTVITHMHLTILTSVSGLDQIQFTFCLSMVRSKNMANIFLLIFLVGG